MGKLYNRLSYGKVHHVCKEHYAYYYVPKSSILLARTGVWKICSVACGFSSIKIDYSDYPKRLISRINEVYAFFNKTSLQRYLIEKKRKLHFESFTLVIVLTWFL